MKSFNILLSLIYDFYKNQKYLNDDLENNYKICQNICRNVINSCDVPMIVEGVNNIPDNDSVLIAANHTSFYDIFILISCINRYMPFAAASELMKYPILNKYINSINCLLIDRNVEDLKLIKKQLLDIEEYLKNGGLILFPEGECNYLDGEIKPFKKGGFMAASKLDTMIVPTYIKTDKMKKIGKWYIPTEEVKVVFGESFKPTEVFNGKVNSTKLSKYTREKVLELKKKA